MTQSDAQIRILVVDDEEQMRRALRSILSARQYTVLLAQHGQQALELTAEYNPDLVILDLTMPGMSGLEVCRELRAWYTAPILILSVRGNEADKIAALDLGADDYLTKPFAAGELLARIRALLRRAIAHAAPPPVVRIDALDIDLARRLVTRAGEVVSLTPTEYDILAYLVQHANCVVTTAMLLAQIWGAEPGDDTQALRAHISHLRKKIEANPKVPRCLLTEPGIGFRFVIPSAQ